MIGQKKKYDLHIPYDLIPKLLFLKKELFIQYLLSFIQENSRCHPFLAANMSETIKSMKDFQYLSEYTHEPIFTYLEINTHPYLVKIKSVILYFFSFPHYS